MHLFCITRGEQDAVRTMMHDLSGQFWPLKTKKAGTHVNTIVQPIQLWSIVVPKESLSSLQQTVHTNDFERYHPKKDSVLVAGLRKMLRANKCPPIPENTKFRPIRKDAIEVLPIGIKEDNTIHQKFGCEGL